MENLNFIFTSGKLSVYCFVEGHGNRTIATYSNVSLDDVSKLVNESINFFLSKTRLSHCKKIFSYKFDC